MRKIISGVVLAASLVASSGAFAWGITWESVTSYGNETIEPQAEYNISVNGNDLRAYEWYTKTRPQKLCIFVASEAGVSLQCDVVEQDQDN